MAMAAVSIAPLGEGTSVSQYVAAALAVLDDHPELAYELGPMFTTLEGEPEAIFAAIQAMQEAVFTAGAARVSTVIKIDDRRDRQAAMGDKVAAVHAHLKQGSGTRVG